MSKVWTTKTLRTLSIKPFCAHSTLPDLQNNSTTARTSQNCRMSEALLFENTFIIESINNQKYDRVSRISAHSEDNATFLMLDVNTELFPLAETERIKLALALTLNLDGSKDD